VLELKEVIMPNQSQKIRVLIVDDCVMTRHFLGDALTDWGYDVVRCRSGEEAWQKLQGETGPVIVLLDWVMPGMSGVELCSRIRHEQLNLKCDYVYVMLVTARQGRDNLLEGMRAGADVYITKPIDLDVLHERVEAGRRIVMRMAGLPAEQSNHLPSASVPQYSSLLNRGDIVEILKQSLEHQWKLKSSLAVLMIALDDLRLLHDAGHGDDAEELLRTVITHLRDELSDGDAFGRYDNEHLLLVLPNRDSGQAMAMAERINSWVKNIELNRQVQGIRSIIGLTVSSYYDSVMADELIRLTQEGLRRAQATGEDKCFLHWSWSVTLR
jgi:two-component system, cell cycle response regulator